MGIVITIVVVILVVIVLSTRGKKTEPAPKIVKQAARPSSMSWEKLYQLEFKVLPEMFEKISNGTLGREYITSKELWMAEWKAMGYNINDIDWDSILIEEEMPAVYIFTFPNPTQPPLAKYGAAVSVATDKITYYTLEKSLFGSWVLGITGKDLHMNLGDKGQVVTKAEFIKMVF